MIPRVKKTAVSLRWFRCFEAGNALTLYCSHRSVRVPAARESSVSVGRSLDKFGSSVPFGAPKKKSPGNTLFPR